MAATIAAIYPGSASKSPGSTCGSRNSSASGWRPRRPTSRQPTSDCSEGRSRGRSTSRWADHRSRTADSEIRCAIQVFVLNAAGLVPALVPGLSFHALSELAALGLAGPRARLAVVESTQLEARVGLQTITATLHADGVEPPLFELVVRQLRSLRVAMRVVGIRIEPAAGPKLEGDAAREAVETAAIPTGDAPAPIEVGDGEPSVTFTLASPTPAPGQEDAKLQRVGRAVAAFAAAAPLWGGGPVYPPGTYPQFQWKPRGEVSELVVVLHCYGPEGKPLPHLPWNVPPMVATLAAVCQRLREDMAFVAVRLNVGKRPRGG